MTPSGEQKIRTKFAGSRLNFDRCSACQTDRAFLRLTRRPEYESPESKIRLADLFCGCGGLSLGVAEAAKSLGMGLEVRVAVDNDEVATKVYAKNFGRAEVRCCPVEALIDGRLDARLTRGERDLAKKVGPIDILVGGPPCQGNSDLNNHTRRSDPRNALYARMARAAAVFSPSLVLIENVPAVRHDVENVVLVTRDALERIGYSVHEDIVDLSSLGAPQRRRRHVVLAVSDSKCDPQIALRSLDSSCSPHLPRSVKWAIEDIMDEKESIFDSASTPSAENKRRIKYLFDKDIYDLPNKLRPVCHHSDHSYGSMYGRLRWDQPAQTVTTGFGSMGQGRYIHPLRHRTITPHEAARLQMIPDFFDFSDVRFRSALATLIGNVVPPVLASTLIRRLIEPCRSSSTERHPAAPTRKAQQ